MKVFLDTSAFAKRYVAEQGLDKVMELRQQADNLVVSVIRLPELVSTSSRLLLDGTLFDEATHAEAQFTTSMIHIAPLASYFNETCAPKLFPPHG